MKRVILLTIFLLLTAVSAGAQPSSNTARHIRYGSALPATCSPSTGDVFWLTVPTIGQYMCLTTNTWTAVGTSTGGVTSIAGTANQITASAATGAVTLSLPASISGITNLTPGGDFTVTLNSVAAVKDVSSGAIVNTLVTSAGLVGVGKTPASGKLDILGDAGVTIVNIAGTQPAAQSGSNPGTSAGSAFVLVGAPGGDTSSTTANTNGGLGSQISNTSGAGGNQTGASSGTARAGNGGLFVNTGGTGGNATAVTGTVKGGGGGGFINAGGVGGTSATSTGGAGGALANNAGAGGITTAAAVSGAGGVASLLGGAGGANSNAAGTSGAGGNASVDAGPAGTASGGATTGNNGQVAIGATNSLVVTIGNTTSATTTVIKSPSVSLNNAAYFSCTALTTNGAGLIGCTISDPKMKQNFSHFSNALGTLNRIHPTTYEWRVGTQYTDGVRHLGFDADDLMKANPYLASYTGLGLKQPEQLAIQALTVQSVQELDAKVTKLMAVVKAQQKEINRLRRHRR